MRMRGAANARARSSDKDEILLTRTLVFPALVSTKSGSTPNCVIVGPRLISTTCAGAPKEASVSSMRRARCWMKSSLTEGASPSSRTSVTEGNFQLITVVPLVVGMVGRLVGVNAVILGGTAGCCIGVYPFVSAESGFGVARRVPFGKDLRGLLSHVRTCCATGPSQWNKSCTEMSKVMETPIISQAIKAITA